jgi:hypothetical protein
MNILSTVNEAICYFKQHSFTNRYAKSGKRKIFFDFDIPFDMNMEESIRKKQLMLLVQICFNTAILDYYETENPLNINKKYRLQIAATIQKAINMDLL